MLAVGSTLGAVLLLICIIVMIWESGVFRGSYHYDDPSGLIAGDQVETLNQENLRKQIVSYETPWLIDTLNSVYVIPVSVTTLRKPEEKGTVQFFMMEESLDLSSSFSKGKKGYYNSKRFDGSYANLILYFPLENRTVSLFNERILIGNIKSYYFKEDILMVFNSAEEDTNKDGIIDLNDTKNLCIYSLKTETLKKVSDGDNSVEEYQFIENSKDVLIQFNLSQYRDRAFSSYRKPSKIMRYRYDACELIDVIPQDIQEVMQKMVEGK